MNRVLRHPNLLAVLLRELGRILHILQWRMSVEVTCHDVDLLAAFLVFHQRVGVVLGEAQALAADQLDAWIGFSVEHVGIVLDELYQVVRVVETAGIVDPPVGLVLQGDSINLHAL